LVLYTGSKPSFLSLNDRETTVAPTLAFRCPAMVQTGGFHVGPATAPAHLAEAYELRRQVFCIEQKLFYPDDQDDFDAGASTIVALADNDAVVGTVRIHEAEPSVWFGSRLAVATAWRRRAGLGAALIRAAVSTAHARGCRRFLAHVQMQNVAMFETLHWQRLETCTLHGLQHALMQADLAYYPPAASPVAGSAGAAA
jgi:putative N-acetyltransferase (TIGR04045 family)